MAQGITGLPVAQGAPQAPQQPQAPGQAAPFRAMTPQQPKTPASELAPYQGMKLQELVAAFQQRPSGPLLGLITKEAEAEKLQQQMAQQQALGAYAQQGPQTVKDIALANAMQVMQPPTQYAAHGGVMHGYAGGGAVAFQNGGLSVGYDRDYNDARRFGINLSPYDAPAVRAEKLQRVQKMREFEAQQVGGVAEIPNEFAAANTMAGYRDPRRGRLDVPFAPPAPVASAPRPPRVNRPGTGIATATPTAAPVPIPTVDPYADIEKGGLADIKAYQDVLRKQGEADPELARLRQAAYDSAQGITTRRERDRAAALEAAQKAMGSPLLENQEALLRLASAFGGTKRVGQGLSAAAGAAGEIRGEQRKAFEAAQKVSREEQNAIDQLNQALAEKRVADRSGDVDRQRQAEIKVAEAQLKVTDLRKGIQTQRDVVADRAEQRNIAREQMANQLKVAQIGAAARTAPTTLTPAQRASFLEKAVDNVTKDPQTNVLRAKAREAAVKAGKPFDEKAFMDKLVDTQFQQLVAAAEGRSPTAPTSAPAPGISPDILSQFKVRPVGQ